MYSAIWRIFFTPLLLLANFPHVLCQQNETAIALPDHGNSTSLGPEEGSECTSSSVRGNFSGCHPVEISRYKGLFIANAALVISIGAPANLVTLLALPYVRLRYPGKFPDLNTNKAILIIHLSLTDFLYCLLGLPFILATLHHGYFPASTTLCSLSSLIRNLIAYADFLTMAAIAVISSIGLVSDRTFFTRFARTPITLAICAGIWLLAFAIISPHIFGFDLFGYKFGEFGWGSGAARCDVTHVESVAVNVYVYGSTIPFLVIFVSYLVLGLCHGRLFGRTNGLSCMHVTMLCLSFAYAIFTAPLVPAHLFDNSSHNWLRMTPFKSMMLYSWYCWMYAINVIIYVVSSSEFRKVYCIFFEDAIAGFATLWANNFFQRTSDTSPPAIEL